MSITLCSSAVCVWEGSVFFVAPTFNLWQTSVRFILYLLFCRFKKPGSFRGFLYVVCSRPLTISSGLASICQGLSLALGLSNLHTVSGVPSWGLSMGKNPFPWSADCNLASAAQDVVNLYLRWDVLLTHIWLVHQEPLGFFWWASWHPVCAPAWGYPALSARLMFTLVDLWGLCQPVLPVCWGACEWHPCLLARWPIHQV